MRSLACILILLSAACASPEMTDEQRAEVALEISVDASDRAGSVFRIFDAHDPADSKRPEKDGGFAPEPLLPGLGFETLVRQFDQFAVAGAG